MKTINSKKRSKSETFIDPKTKKRSGFAGLVSVYDSVIYVDTRNGTGYDAVINKLKPLICKFALKYHFNGNSFEDTRQDIIVHILEGIPQYDPSRNMKLSSFLQMRVGRRLINELRNRSRANRNATFLNIRTYNVTCNCGYNFVETVGKGDIRNCPECDSPVDYKTKSVPINMFEVNESMLTFLEEDLESDTYINMQESIINDEIKPLDEEVIHMYDMEKWLEDEDPRIVKALELMYFHDYSISAAAKEVNLTGAGLNMKLKDLKNKKIVCELFDR